MAPRRDELLRKELTDDFPAEQMRIVGFLRTLYPRVLVSLHAEALHNKLIKDMAAKRVMVEINLASDTWSSASPANSVYFHSIASSECR